MKIRLSALLGLLIIVFSCSDKGESPTRILVFSKTVSFRHESIPAGIEAIREIARKENIEVDTTENSANFNEENLRRYKAVIFLSTTGDVLNQEQQNDFERFIQAGGGYLGIHAASDTEYDWPWYGKLVGAYFTSHPNNPNVRKGEFLTVDHNHPATDSLPDKFERSDEFYNFRDVKDDLKVLVKIDEKSYEGGTNGENHPMSWYHEFDGGRAFYTAMGHTNESFQEPLVLYHIRGGLRYVLGGDKPKDLDYKAVRTKRVPEENRFTKVVLAEKLEEPVELAVLPDSRVLFVERRGNVKLYDPQSNQVKLVTKIPVSTKYKFKDGSQSEAEDGLLGLAIDPKFSENNWIYMYYSPAGDDPKNILTRYEFRGDKLIEESRKIILEVPVQREQCCHTGGSIAFDGNGNLFLSTGDNTSPRNTAYAPIDERPGRMPWDAQKGSANTNDLRGKIIRIHPEADGTYTIPEGNLFPKGTAKTRPEIYMMGGRNPYRISVDKRTGYLYWGDVGPDAGADSVNRGTRAFDEINQARKPGFFGWPYFVGDNRAYYERDFATGKIGELYNPEKPINNSPNNTGLTELPPAQKAFIWYPYDESKEFPLLGKGGRTAMAGPVFYADDFKKAKRAFPDYFEGKLFIYEWMRGWVIAVTMDKEGNYVSMEKFMPSHKFSNPMDMEFGPEGDLYMLEYGTAWFQGNEDARLIRIEYNGGNRKPAIQLAADKPRGAVPMTVQLSSKGTKDFDRDELKYRWVIKDNAGKELASFKEADAKYTFDKAGVYKATLEVDDGKGGNAARDLEILAGNEPPQLSFDIEGNKTFFFPGNSFEYEVKVTDKEDGTLGSGITPEEISVNIDYLPEGFDKTQIVQGHLSADATAEFIKGKNLMDNSDCKSCHLVDKKSIGPMYKDVAKKYKNDPKAVEALAKKVINGGGGVWGDVNMAAHPQVSMADATEMVKYILSLDEVKTKPGLPTKGSFTTSIQKGVSPAGVFLLRASYADKGANGIPSARSEQSLILRNASVEAGTADYVEGIQKFKMGDMPTFMIGQADGSYIGFRKFDLTGINQVTLVASAPKQYGMTGGKVEVRLDSPTGELLGESAVIEPVVGNGQAPPAPSIVSAKLKQTDGFHDIYFVLRNPNSLPGQSLFVLLNIQFGAQGAKQLSMN